MDEYSTSDNSAWASANAAYWKAWLELTRHALTGETDGIQQPTIGTNSLMKWWEAVSFAASPTTKDFIERLVGFGQPYFEMAERFTDRNVDKTDTAINRWLDDLANAFGSVANGSRFADENNLRATFAFWDLPLATWQHATSSITPLHSDIPYGSKQNGPAIPEPELSNRIDRLLAIPPVGYTRELQEQHQELIRLALSYLKTLREYTNAFAHIGIKSVERFRMEIRNGEHSTHSLRELYDAWVDVCEKVYADYVRSEEYSLLYGKLVNALAALKGRASVLTDDFLERMNLPTRREIDSMHKHMHETRRENRALYAEMTRIRERLDETPPASKRSRKTKHH